MSQDDNYTNVILEEVRDQNTQIMEAIGTLPTRQEFQHLQDDVNELKADVKTIKAVVTEHSVVIKDHEKRITTLETA